MLNTSTVYGARGKVGLIVPANNSVIEPEFWSRLPPDVAVYATRVRAKGDLTPQAVRRMEGDVDEAAATIAATGIDVLAYCDMVTSFIMAPGWNEEAQERLGHVAGVPVVTAWTAMRDALAHVGARRIALGTPYPAAIHALARPFFEGAGVTVVTDATLDILAMRDVPMVQADRLLAFVAPLAAADCDAVVLLATDLPTFGVIAAIEQRWGRPVLTSNQVLLWRTLALLGAKPTGALGRLTAPNAA